MKKYHLTILLLVLLGFSAHSQVNMYTKMHSSSYSPVSQQDYVTVHNSAMQRLERVKEMLIKIDDYANQFIEKDIDDQLTSDMYYVLKCLQPLKGGEISLAEAESHIDRAIRYYNLAVESFKRRQN
jgi:hypothetical protein